nr:MAG TPA: hypothetical protein [Caudoviricetes sp.]DAP13628.1 MAG TPA: hypothetical protein [Caudoviricetes sp.]
MFIGHVAMVCEPSKIMKHVGTNVKYKMMTL